jgi:hypothetical protein
MVVTKLSTSVGCCLTLMMLQQTIARRERKGNPIHFDCIQYIQGTISCLNQTQMNLNECKTVTSKDTVPPLVLKLRFACIWISILSLKVRGYRYGSDAAISTTGVLLVDGLKLCWRVRLLSKNSTCNWLDIFLAILSILEKGRTPCVSSDSSPCDKHRSRS